MINGLIFDFDGLLIDTETPAFVSWQQIYAEHGQELTLDMWQAAVGRAPGHGFSALEHLARQVGEPFDRAAVLARRQEIKRMLAAEQALLPGVESILADVRRLGLPCAVASSSGREWVEGWLRHHGIYDAFACVRTSDDVEHAKPAPDLFLSAAACLGVEPRTCLVFEDSPNGMIAARAAGMRCVAVPGAITSQLPLPQVDLRLAALNEYPLTDILALCDRDPVDQAGRSEA